MIEYKTAFSRELEEAYLEGFKDAMNMRILKNITIDSDVIFELFCKQTARYLEHIGVSFAEANKHIEYLRSKRDTQRTKEV